ncbi:grpE, partial [Mucuna pruriens]
MATFLSNQSVLGSSPCCTHVSSKPFQTLKPTILSFPSRGFPTPLISSVKRRTSFKSSQDSPQTTNDVTEETQNDLRGTNDGEDKKSLPSLRVLVEAYKEAFFNGDENTLAKIEEGIYSIANRKNKLIKQVSILAADKADSKEKYLRLQADFDNFRKRSDKERLNTQSDAQQEVIEKLLLMVDNFERTKQQTKAATEKEKKIDVSYQEILRSHHVSVVATVGKPFNPLLHPADFGVMYWNMTTALTSEYLDARLDGWVDYAPLRIANIYVEEVQVKLGKNYTSPLVLDTFLLVGSLHKIGELHEAIAREESREFKKGIIIKESRRGFLLRDRVLRPALVKVSLGPGNIKSPVSPDKSMGQPSTAAGIDER